MDHDVGQYEQVSSCESSDVVDTQTLSLISSIKFVIVNDFFFKFFLFFIFLFLLYTPGCFNVNVATRLPGSLLGFFVLIVIDLYKAWFNIQESYRNLLKIHRILKYCFLCVLNVQYIGVRRRRRGGGVQRRGSF